MNHEAEVLRMRDVRKSFTSPRGNVEVLRAVDMSLRAGAFAAVTGPSGSGKTTLLNLAGLLDRPSAGRVYFEGRDTCGLDERAVSEIRKLKVGMVFQNFSLLPHRSALDNVLFRFRYLDTPPPEARRAAEEALARVGLVHVADQPARLLSGGEMQRVAIARAVSVRPALLLADEPTGNLDADAAHAVMEAFRELNREGITVLLATHNAGLFAYCSHRYVVRDGAVSEEGCP